VLSSSSTKWQPELIPGVTDSATLCRKNAGAAVLLLHGSERFPKRLDKNTILVIWVSPPFSLALFDLSNRQIMNPSFVILVTGNRHLIFHSGADTVGNGLVVLGR